MTLLEQEYIAACMDCAWRRKSEDMDELAKERDKHKARKPTHRIEWYVRERTIKKIKRK